MKCKRCETQFSPSSAMVTDHKYVQECIDALKGRVRELEKVVDGGEKVFTGFSIHDKPGVIVASSNTTTTWATLPAHITYLSDETKP